MNTPSGGRSYFKMPALLLFGSQFLTALTIFFIIVPTLVSINGQAPALPVILVIQGTVATVIGYFLGLPKWWAGVQLALPFAAFYSVNLQIPGPVWLGLFALIVLVYWNSARDGIPLYLSNPTTWSALAGLLPEKKGIRIADLGGGIGGTALYLARNRPDAHIVSIESAPIPSLISRLRGRYAGVSNLDMMSANFWNQNLADFQIVYAFLSPAPMERLFDKVRAEMKPGSLFISNSFDIPGVVADEIVELDDARSTKLHIWKI